MIDMTDSQTLVIGAGPAGLTAAYELLKRGVHPLVFEKSDQVGGIARTEKRDGYRYDIGGHRFFTKVPEVNELWHEILTKEFIRVPRLSRIFYRGRYFNYPIELFNAFRNLGAYESFRILLSYMKWKAFPHKVEETFEQWVTNRFGARLYWHFFKTYTEKVWGIPCDKIRADWAAQRIKNMSLKTAVVNALVGKHDTSTLIKEFDYPRLGPGQMWERVQEIVDDGGGRVLTEVDIEVVRRDGNRIRSVVARQNGQATEFEATDVISTMPLTELIFKLNPPPPPEVLDAAHGLKYRDFLIVGLVMKGERMFPDNWIYIHSPKVRVGRIQNFGNWSAAMVPEAGKSSLGMEYFCSQGDATWEMSDADLVALAGREIAELGLAPAESVERGVVIRQPKAYPVYDEAYRAHLDVIRKWLGGLENLQTVGRNGMHRYNNQDHSMLTAILAVRNLFGEDHDLWEVNVERSYHEDFQTGERKPGRPALEAESVGVTDMQRDADISVKVSI